MADQNTRPKLSVVLPVFNEPHIDHTLFQLKKELDQSYPNYEIICVNDGSHDKTLKILNQCRFKKVKILSYPMNVGKGFALCFGFAKSTGKLVAFYDADLEIDPKHIRMFADLMDITKADMVVGSKRHPLSRVHYSSVRRLYSRLYQLLVRLLFGLKISDTQVGLKLFRRQVLAKVVPKLVVKTWAFDLEILVVASLYGFNHIVEAPIKLQGRKYGSKIGWAAIRHILIETAAVFYRRYILRYYSRPISQKSHLFPSRPA